MTTLSRVYAKLFGSAADPNINGQIGQFGSAKAGTKLNTADVATIQALSAYLEGWAAAVVTGRNFPPIEEVTGVLKTFSYQICYMLQEGIPTWDSQTEYSATSIVKSFTGNQLNFYKSKIDGNTGNPITDTNNWTQALIIGEREIGVPQITLDFSGSLPANCIDLQGQEVSQTTYNNLYAIYGSTYNIGDEAAGNFRLPDFSDRAIYGGTSAGYIDAGLPDLKLSVVAGGTHSHTNSVSTVSNHTHNYLKTSQSRAYADGDPTEDERKYFVTTISNESTATSGAGSHNHTVTINNGGSHTHSLTTAAGSLVNTAASVFTDGVKVRVYTRYK